MKLTPEKLAEYQAKLDERDRIIREQWIKVMELRILREQLDKCQKTEGVNHYENCKDWSERYLKLLASGEAKITGWRKVKPYPSPPPDEDD